MSLQYHFSPKTPKYYWFTSCSCNTIFRRKILIFLPIIPKYHKIIGKSSQIYRKREHNVPEHNFAQLTLCGNSCERGSFFACAACPALPKIIDRPFRTGSDQRLSCFFASFAWNPADNQWATLHAPYKNFPPHFYGAHLHANYTQTGLYNCYLSGISR